MAYFHLRYDYKSADHLERFIDFVRRIDCANRLIVLEKKSSNDIPHLHSIFTHRKTLSTVRQQFLTKFPDTDGKKKEYQLKEIPEAELYDAEKYLCKGDKITPPDIVLQTGKYTTERTVQLYTEFWMNGGPSEAGSASGSSEPDGTMQPFIITHRIEKVVKPKKNFYNDVVQYLFLQYPDREWNIRDTPLMFRAIMKLHGKHFRPYGPQQLENEMNVIMNILVFESHYSDMWDQVARRGNIPHITTEFR